MLKGPRKRLLSVFVCLAGLAATAWGQVGTGTIAGTVRDATGAVIPGVSVSIRNLATGLSSELVTNEAGRYESPPLKPGSYELSAILPGFKTALARIDLNVNQRAVANVTLQVGEVSEQVTVEATAVLLEKETSTLGNVRTAKAVSELPVNSRNFTHLVHLTAGSVPLSTQSGGLPITMKRGAPITSVNGLRGEDNNILMEGLSNFENHNGLGILIYPPIDAIQEFKLQTNSADAQFGRAGGATLNVALKSGGNEFHGTLFEFHRNSALDAKNFFDDADQKIPHFVHNQFGATLGGPLVQDKIFFFVAYEGTRTRQGQSFVRTVPTEAFRSGDFSEHPNTIFDPLTTRPNADGSGFIRDPFPNNTIPVDRIDSVGRNLVNLYPGPNRSGIVNNFGFNPVRETNGDNFDIKVDHLATDRDNLTYRISFGGTDIFDPGSLPAPAVGVGGPTGTNKTPHVQFALNETHTFSPAALNEFRFGVTRLNLTQQNINFGRDVSTEVGIPGANTGSDLTSGLNINNVTGFAPLGENGFVPAVIVSENYQWNDNFHLTRGRHSIRMGGEVARRRYNAFQSFSARGTLNFSTAFTSNPVSPARTGIGLADLLLGRPINGTIQVIDGTRGLRRTEFGFYIQDDFQVAPRLTLNLGLRYELFSGWPWVEVADRQSQFVPELGDVFLVNSSEVPERSGTEMDWNNWAPRLGLAYQLTPSTVLRAGYGIFYNAPPLDVTRNLAGNPPFVGRFSFSNNQFDFLGARAASEGFERPAEFSAEGGEVNAVDRNARIPYVQQWNVNLQRQLPGNTLLTVAYVGTKGTKLATRPNINQARPGPGPVAPRRPWPQFNNIPYSSNQAASIYHGLQVSADKRYSNGVSYLLAYTWSHAIDNASGLFGSPQDVLNFDADRGNSGFDLRQRFVFSFLYDLPLGRGRAFGRDLTGFANHLIGGWQFNGIVQLYDGFPFTPGSAINTLNGSGGQRADVVAGCDPRLPASERSPERYFRTECFTTPPPFTFGNAGRNILRGPGTANLDLSLFKTVYLNADENVYLQFRAEFFNAFNRPQFNNPSASIGSAAAGTINSAGSLLTFQRTPRQIQFALRFFF